MTKKRASQGEIRDTINAERRDNKPEEQEVTEDVKIRANYAARKIYLGEFMTSEAVKAQLRQLRRYRMNED